MDTKRVGQGKKIDDSIEETIVAALVSQWLRGKMLPQKDGRPRDPENLQKYWPWTVQHFIGVYEIEERPSGREKKVLKQKSYRDIAKMLGQTVSSVEEAIKSVIAKLNPEKLQRRFQPAARLILNASKGGPR